MKDYFSNKKILKGFRKNLRNRSTSAETALWLLLKNKKLESRKFRRQHSLGYYIVDFYCHEERLIIELDGDVHGDYASIEKDKIRDEELFKKGFQIIRFENRLVFQDKEYVLEEIKKRFKR
jgi:very-short-patch-repair endonuclease